MEPAVLLILIASAAFVLPIVAERIKVPAVVPEILFGIIIGPSVFGIVSRNQILDVLAQLGFFLLMFLSGFEIDFSKLRRQGLKGMVNSLGVFGMTLAFAFLAARSLGYGLFMMLVLATTSVGVVVPSVRNARLESTNVGQVILVLAILADFLTLLLVTAFAIGYRQGIGLQLLNIPAFFIVLAATLLALRRAAWWFPERFSRLFGGNDPDELGIRASLALMLVFVGISELFGIEPILGAFLAGTMFALVFRHRGQLEAKLSGFSYGFLIPIFFINVGIRFELHALLGTHVALRALALLVAAILIKLVPTMLTMLRGLSAREALAAGVLTSARLSLIIAVAELGVELHIIGRGLQSSIILLALITTMLAPTVFERIAPAGARPSRDLSAADNP